MHAQPQAIEAGMEVELGPEEFGRIANHFDWNHYSYLYLKLVHFVPDAAIDAYLDVERNFESLPAALQQRLTRGLTLPAQIFTLSPAQAIVPGPAPGVAAAPAPAPAQGIFSGQGFYVPPARAIESVPREAARSAPEPPGTSNAVLSGGLWLSPDVIEARAQTNRVQASTQYWSTIAARWRAMNFRTRLRAVKFQNFPASVRAQALMASTQELIPRPSYRLLRPLQSLSPEIRAIWNRLNIAEDIGGTLEVTHQRPVLLAQAYQDLRRILHWAGKINADELISGASNAADPYHFLRKHASAQLHVTFDTPVMETAWVYNLYLMLSLNHPEIRLFDSRSHVEPNLPELKGLLRVVDPYRVEFRMFAQSPEQTVREFTELLDPTHFPDWARSRFTAQALDGLLLQLNTQAPNGNLDSGRLHLFAISWAKAVRRFQIGREQVLSYIPVLERWHAQTDASPHTRAIARAMILGLADFVPERARELMVSIERTESHFAQEIFLSILNTTHLGNNLQVLKSSIRNPFGVSLGDNQTARELRTRLMAHQDQVLAGALLPTNHNETDFANVEMAFREIAAKAQEQGFVAVNMQQMIERVVQEGDPRVRELVWKLIQNPGHFADKLGAQLWKVGGTGVREALIPWVRGSHQMRVLIAFNVFLADHAIQDQLVDQLPDFTRLGYGEYGGTAEYILSRGMGFSNRMQAALVDYLRLGLQNQFTAEAGYLLKEMLDRPLAPETLKALATFSPRDIGRYIDPDERKEFRGLLARRRVFECDRLLAE